MKLTILGCSGAYPGPLGPCSSYLVTTERTRVLVDCGAGSLANLHPILGSTYDLLDGVVLSHLHGDHISDFLVLRHAVAAAREVGSREEPLVAYAPPEPEEVFRVLPHHDHVLVRRIPEEGLVIGDLKLSFARAAHGPLTYAMRIAQEAGPALAYTADTGPCDEVAALVEGADLLLAEATWTDDRAGEGHLSGREAGRLARDARVGGLVVTHTGPLFDPEEILREAREEFPAAVLARPGGEYIVGREA